MKKIKCVLYRVVSLIFLFLSTSHLLQAQSILGGLFQFAKNTDIAQINIAVYHCGKTIVTQKQTTGIPKITYEIPKYNEQTTFYILIVPTAPSYELKQFPDQDEQQNTIDHLKIDTKAPYLFYTLELIADTMASPDAPVTYHWDITESSLPDNGQMPDSTIIVTYFPHCIKAIKGGNNLELPTIFIDNSPTNLFGSEESFDDAIIRLQLTSLDLKALHVPTKQKIHTDSCRVMIMDTIT